MPLSSLHKGTIVSAPSPLLFKALRVTCLRVVLGRYQRRSLTFFAFVQAYVAEVIRYNLLPGAADVLNQLKTDADYLSKLTLLVSPFDDVVTLLMMLYSHVPEYV